MPTSDLLGLEKQRSRPRLRLVYAFHGMHWDYRMISLTLDASGLSASTRSVIIQENGHQYHNSTLSIIQKQLDST